MNERGRQFMFPSHFKTGVFLEKGWVFLVTMLISYRLLNQRKHWRTLEKVLDLYPI